MRLILCLVLLLGACSAPALRCDKHLLPINPPAAKSAAVIVDGKSS